MYICFFLNNAKPQPSTSKAVLSLRLSASFAFPPSTATESVNGHQRLWRLFRCQLCIIRLDNCTVLMTSSDVASVRVTNSNLEMKWRACFLGVGSTGSECERGASLLVFCLFFFRLPARCKSSPMFNKSRVHSDQNMNFSSRTLAAIKEKYLYWFSFYPRHTVAMNVYLPHGF